MNPERTFYQNRRPLVKPDRWGLIFGWVTGLALALAGPAPAAEPRAAAVVPVGLAGMDSLLAVSAAAAAVALGEDLLRAWGADPLYGWQIQGRLGLALLQDGRPTEALAHLETAVQANPQDPGLHRALGSTLRELGRRGRALAEYESVVELAPGDFAARLEFGQFLLEFGDHAGAEREVLRAHDLCRGCVETARALANVYLYRQDYAAALAPLQAVWAVEPEPQVRRLLAIALERSGRPDEVASLLQACPAQDLDPDEHRLLVQVEAGRPGTGAPHSLTCAQMLAAEPDRLAPALRNDPAFWGMVAANLLTCGHYEPGLQAADRSIALAPANAVFRNNRAALLLKLDRQAEAAAEWERAVALDPSLAVEGNR